MILLRVKKLRCKGKGDQLPEAEIVPKVGA